MTTHHTNAYTLKESIGGNSDKFCKLLNVKCLLGILETTLQGKFCYFKQLYLGNQVTKTPDLGLKKRFLRAQISA